jgi:carboxyl-terminal processing protease
MIRKFWWIALACFAFLPAAQAVSPDTGTPTLSELKPTPQQAEAAHLAAELLTRYHYKPTPLDDAMSGKIFDGYLKALDSEKLFFVQTDIDHLSSVRTTLDDAIIKEDLAVPFSMFNLYTQRVAERFTYARSLLKDGFDFRQKESYQYDRAKEAWPSSEPEMREVWRKRVKNDWLRLKLVGKSDKSIAATLDKRYDTALKRLTKLTSDDAFQTFMNAYTMAVEPHTNYMGPRAAQEFDISMKLSLVGIGAVLAEKDDYTLIRELVPGGPAALSAKLKVGDRILGVAQGEKGVMVDTQGWRLDDTVALIRGASDSTVVLDVLPADAGPDGKHVAVTLVRKKITLEEQSAKKSVLPVTDGGTTRQIGVITLPGFYEDFDARQKGTPDFKSATRDVARLLDELKKEKVDGILIDLRNNGGGSLSEAIDLTGLFVGKGPVVQQRDPKGNISVLSNTSRDVAWDGPLGVLINRASASASEIFAAAIQDYGRGMIIGEPSFGKGTVQTMIDLDQIAHNDTPKFGDLKFTVAQFFRVNGGTTQLRGVTPDISFPSASDAEDFGESSFDNALPWIQIKAANYVAADDLKSIAPTLLARNEAREKTNKDFVCLQQDIAEFSLLRKNNQVSLNEVERRQLRDSQEARQKSCDASSTSPVSAKNTQKDKAGQKTVPSARLISNKSLRDDDGLQANERNLVTELANEKARKDAKDVLLEEAAHILSDEANLMKPNVRLVSDAKPS